jgi:hypothetical protein
MPINLWKEDSIMFMMRFMMSLPSNIDFRESWMILVVIWFNKSSREETYYLWRMDKMQVASPTLSSGRITLKGYWPESSGNY